MKSNKWYFLLVYIEIITWVKIAFSKWGTRAVCHQMYDKRMEQWFLSLDWSKQLTYSSREKELTWMYGIVNGEKVNYIIRQTVIVHANSNLLKRCENETSFKPNICPWQFALENPEKLNFCYNHIMKKKKSYPHHRRIYVTVELRKQYPFEMFIPLRTVFLKTLGKYRYSERFQ